MVMYLARQFIPRCFPVVVLLLWQFLSVWSHAGAGWGADRQIVVAYWPVWAERAESDVQRLPVGAVTYLILAFAQPVLDREAGTVTLNYSQKTAGEADSMASWSQVVRASGAKTMFSVGGWGLSADFSDLTITPLIRSRLVDCILAEIREQGFDGVDLDWEFPVEGGDEGQPHRDEDRDSLYELVRELRLRLDQMGELTGKRYRLSVAVSGDPTAQEKRYRLAAMVPHVDWFHLMAYDFAGSWIPVTAHTAALYPVKNQTGANQAVTVSESVASMISQGVPASKIILGINLAGKRYEEVVFQGTQFLSRPYGKINFQAEFEGKNNFYLLYKLLEPATREKHSPTFQLGWDLDAQASYLYDREEGIYVSMETPRSVSAKMRFARQKQLLGTMLWSLDKDGEAFPVLRSVIEAWPAVNGDIR